MLTISDRLCVWGLAHAKPVVRRSYRGTNDFERVRGSLLPNNQIIHHICVSLSSSRYTKVSNPHSRNKLTDMRYHYHYREHAT